MKIDENQIETKAYAGKTGEGKPIVYILTKGGLHAFFVKSDSSIESLAAAPHKAIAQWMAEKKDKEIQWDDSFLNKSETDHEGSLFQTYRTLMFAPTRLAKNESRSDCYIIYDISQKTITLITKSDLIEEKDNINPYALVRRLDLLEEPVFLMNCEEIKYVK